MSASSAPTDITPASIWHRPKISDEILAPRYGYPLKLRIPTKLGFKNPKWITAIFVTNRFPGGLAVARFFA
jgi:hypothetical protein